MITKRIASLAAFALITAASFAQTGQPVTVVVDGSPIVFPDQQPMESNDRVLVPLRGVFEKLGASVDWNPADQTISAHKGRRHVKLAIGQLDASVDDQPVHMDVPATLVGGTTMVPLRFVSEALGAHVRWNAQAHEVDIQRSTDYDMPQPRNDHHPVPPPVVVRTPPPPPVDRRPHVEIMTADSVIPFTLNTRLSSRNARPGDQFTATIFTGSNANYYGLPGGSIAYGTVAFSHPMDRGNPGEIELRFDHLVMPNGRTLPLVGKLIGLDSGSVVRLPNGRIMSRDRVRHDRVVWTGSGPGVGVVLGFHVGHAIADVEIGQLVQGNIRMQGRRPAFHDVELVPGTQLGIRLYQDLVIPR
jgi:hypothetical protein